MKKFDTYLFDLDGTLIDSKPGIVESLKYTLSYFDIEENDEKTLNSFIGPPLVHSFINYYGFKDDKAALATKIYREYYLKKGMFNISLYPDSVTTLKALKDKGVNIGLATSKIQNCTNEILDNLDITNYFDHIQGADEVSIYEKPQVVAACLKSLNAIKGGIDKDKTVIVGDRKYDIIGAKANGIYSIGVLYGYSEADELKDAGADYIISELKEILV